MLAAEHGDESFVHHGKSACAILGEVVEPGHATDQLLEVGAWFQAADELADTKGSGHGGRADNLRGIVLLHKEDELAPENVCGVAWGLAVRR